MADFRFCIIKCGKEGEELREFVSILEIIPEKGEKVIELPSHFEGKPVALIGYRQGKLEGGMRYHDWHHPAQGFDGYEPAEYFAEKYSLFSLPPRIKKIIFPAEIHAINVPVFNKKSKSITYEISPENQYYEVVNNKIVPKHKGE
ncbi:MAG: hypothetical protein IJW21_09185 [Clostridia bacterium]|nr:hypothetical protein [Clostridia bacterium]